MPLKPDKPEDLLPCPFCGSSAKLQVPEPGYGLPFVACTRCCDGPTKRTEAEAIAAWNTRQQAPTDEAAQLVEELEALAARYKDTMGLTRDGAIRRIGKMHDALLDAAAALQQPPTDEHLRLALFRLSARLKDSGFLDDDTNHAAYEQVVAAINAAPRQQSTPRPTPGAKDIATLITRWENRREGLLVRPDDRRAFIEREAAALRPTPDPEAVERLRKALIECGRAAGAFLADEVSTDFLMYVPGEVRAKIASLSSSTTVAVEDQ